MNYPIVNVRDYNTRDGDDSAIDHTRGSVMCDTNIATGRYYFVAGCGTNVVTGFIADTADASPAAPVASEKAAALKRAADELAEIYAAREAEAYLAETNKKLIDAMAKVELADAAVDRTAADLAEAQVAAAEVQSLREKYEEIIDKEIDTSEKRVILLKAELIK